MPFISGGSGGGIAGKEIGYTQITAPTNITDTSEATATALISPGALTFDGTPVLVTFFGVVFTDSSAVGDNTIVTLFEGATQITRLCYTQTLVTANPNVETMVGMFRFTPTVGSHTYKVCAFATAVNATPRIQAGTGGTGGFPPAFVRFTKV